MLGQVARKFATSQMARTLATLLGGGLPLVNALDIAAQVDRQPVHGRRSSRSSARACAKASRSRRRSKRGDVFPEVAVKMAEVGESTGALQDMLNTVADFYDEEISTDDGAVRHAGRTGAARRHGHRHRRAAAGAVHAALPAELGAARSHDGDQSYGDTPNPARRVPVDLGPISADRPARRARAGAPARRTLPARVRRHGHVPDRSGAVPVDSRPT